MVRRSPVFRLAVGLLIALTIGLGAYWRLSLQSRTQQDRTQPGPFPDGSQRVLAPTHTDLSALDIIVDTGTSLLAEDPLGRRTGIDPDTGIEFTDIPDSAYYPATNLANAVTGFVPADPVVSILSISDPADGTYYFTVSAASVQSYTVDFRGYDRDGNPTLVTVTGQASSDTPQTYRVSYSSAPGVPLNVQLVASIDIRPEDTLTHP